MTKEKTMTMETISHFTRLNSDPVYAKLNNELTWSYQIIDKFLYSLSHEFRGPLKSISGLVKLLDMSMTGQDEQNCLRYIESATATLEQLLDKLEQDVEMTRSRINHTPIILTDEINVILNEFEGAVNKKNICIQVESDQVHPFVCEAERLRLALRHVLMNALTFSDDEKQNKFIVIGVQANEECCNITIADNGIGIEPAVLSKIFEPFYKGSSQSAGMGVGLYLAKKSLRKIGGEIRVESILGKGTAFTINCPNQLL